MLGAVVALSLAAAACGSDATSATSSTAGTGESAFPAERCDANREAGTVKFLTSFNYAAAASIIDVVAADAQGYFEAVCLDVELEPGFSTANVAAVAANQAQMTSLGSFSEVAVANAADADLVAVAVEGQTAVETLLVEKGKGISKLADLEGHKIGIKGAIPFSVRAMLAKAGVDESTLTQIEVDFNPITLFETEIDALPAYKSNEPRQLDDNGYEGKYDTFDPADEDIPASFAVFTTSRGFAQEHPSAVADFLRAALKGFEWAAEHQEEAVALSLKLGDPELFFSPESETFRWATESELVRSSTPSGEAIGTIDPARLEAEVRTLEELGVIDEGAVDAKAAYDTSFMDEITKDGALVWLS